MVNIRLIENNDVEFVEKLFEEYSGRKMDSPLKDLVNNFPAVVAEQEDQIIGFCYSRKYAPEILEILNLFVRPSDRNKGIGGYLVANVERLAAEKFEAVVLVNSAMYPTKDIKTPANRFWQSNGFNEMISTRNSCMYGKVVG